MKRYELRFYLVLISSFFFQFLYAQKEANVWYFGRHLGLDFNSGVATPLNDGMLNTTEGVATISSSGGRLHFYTDGSSIWNRFHQVMPNGTGLFGNYSSTQSAVIVPKIGDTTRYYVFTVDALLGTRGLNYSVVNMTLDNGKGDVELKNVPLNKNSVEKITAVKHCNNRDVWVLSHDTASNGYYAYLVTPAGVNTVPVISHTGVVLPGKIPPASFDSSWLGYMKASPNGKKIAAAHWTVNVDVSDFDNATGVVSNSISLYQPGDPHYLSYGVEFSPNSNLLYSTVFYTDPVNAQKRNALNQYDVTSGNAAAMRASKQVISLNSDPVDTYAALQIAPDGKMYMAKRSYKHISSVSFPNIPGPGCTFTFNAIQFSLGIQESSYGLPTFVQSYFYPVDSFSYVVNCPGLSTSFTYVPSSNVLSVLWNFDDPGSGANNTSTQNNPVHIFSAPGTYTVKLIKFTSCGPDTLTQTVNTNTLNSNLGPDIVVCGGNSVLLNSSATGSTNTFLWQDGSTNPTFLATSAGLYWVQATNSLGCSSRDSINVNFNPTPPVFNLGSDSSLCAGDTLLLNATVSNATSYLWNTGASSATIRASQAGLFWCEVNRGGCIFRDSLTITSIRPRPVVNLGSDVTLCTGNSVSFDASNANSTYLWQNGSTNPTIVASSPGLYWVEATHNLGCSERDSVIVSVNPAPVFNLGVDNSICAGDTLLLNATAANAISYTWSTGATTPAIKAYQVGTYWCEVSNGGCVYRDSLTITSIRPRPAVNLGNDVILCTGNTVSFDASSPNCTYLWQDGSNNPGIVASSTGLYWVEVTHNLGCSKRDSVLVTVNPAPVFNLGADNSICAGDTLLLNATVTNAISYTWSTGATTPTIKVSRVGTYWCEVSNGGCVYRDTLKINAINPMPVINLGIDQTLCEGITTDLDATYPNASYTWQNGSTNAIYTVSQQGIYHVKVNLNGCIKSDSIVVKYNLKPVFTLGPDQSICPGNTIALSPLLNPGWQLSWQDGSTQPSYTITQTGLYSLTATNSCGSRTDDLIISKGICTVFIPNAFTPNGDGINDLFKVLGTEVVKQFNFSIYNRYGQIVFESNDKAKGWDGKFKGQASPGGGYVYLLNYKEHGSEELKRAKGSLILIR